MRSVPRTLARCVPALSLLIGGCNGVIYSEPGDAGPSRPVIDYDAGRPVPGTDAGRPIPGMDAGAPIPGVDAGPPIPGVDAGPGTDAGPLPPGMDAGPPRMDAGPPPRPDAGPPPRPDAGPPPTPDAGPPTCGSSVERQVINLVNMDRTSRGLGPVTCDVDMTRTARLHSADMCANNYFSHTGLDGRSPFDRMRDEGVVFRTAGENIAQGQRSASAVHSAWMGSSGHRANILNGAFGRIGVGLDTCGGRYYWTQVFAN